MAMDDLKENFDDHKKIAEEIEELSKELELSNSSQEREMIFSQIKLLAESLKKSGQGVVKETEKISVPKQLSAYQPLSGINLQPTTPTTTPVRGEITQGFAPSKKREKVTSLERLTLKRMKRKVIKVVKIKEKKPNLYVKMASSIFSKTSMGLIKKGKFHMLKRNLIKANLEFVPANYISLIFFTTILSFFVAILVTTFFLFFNVVISPPFIVPTEDSIGPRFLKVFLLLFASPAAVYLFSYFYPSMERKSLEGKLNHELPFAVIHMSSISNSMIEPSKIFAIIISTGEYVNLSKEFIKLLNEINIYGYDFVTALRDMAFNSPSRKLSDLYNGLATTINSGGDLPKFFDERAETLLFEHKIEVEKEAKSAETFMDIYISVVIAAPMILMLLLMMMRISGLGLSLSTGMITLVMVLGVSLMNIMFLAFLQLKKSD